MSVYRAENYHQRLLFLLILALILGLGYVPQNAHAVPFPASPDKIGVVRNNNTWLLDVSGNGAYGAGDLAYTFGKAGDVYVTGDWDGNDKTEIGVVRNNNTWLLDASGNGVYGAGDLAYTFGKAGEVNVTGDWEGDAPTEIGGVRNNNTCHRD
jgi:5'-nucleotidase